ncbi:hypothetical protein TDB9533_04286 [Thalassocella blandensis]|nr:hypothetical protein TDB9533_04286 [Thalassocella blandensis]
MKREIQPSKVIQLRPHLHGAAYQSFIRSIPFDHSRSLNIEIDFHQFEQTAFIDDDFMELLIAEIKLWAKFLGKRHLLSITLNHCLPVTPPFELTRLMHVLASHFHISEQDRLFMVIAPLDQLTSECLALLKGLGFNELRLIIAPDELARLDEIRQQIAAIRVFGFEKIGIHLHPIDCSDELSRQLKSIKNACALDSITLGSHHSQLALSTTLEEFSPHTIRHMDFLSLGPDAISQIGNMRLRNFCSKSRYQSAIGAGRLPVLTG